MSAENAENKAGAGHRPVLANSRQWYARGLRHGIPICLGYFAVSFALGIAARGAGMNALQAFVMSLGMTASAGEFAAIGLIASGAGALEMIFTTLIVNLRYFLMSCSLAQKLPEGIRPVHRFLTAYCVTDEIFGLSAAVPGGLNPFYSYGMMTVAAAGWCLGTVLGVLAGSILPEIVVSALSVAMYGMFLAIVIPPSRKSRFILGLVAISMVASGLFSVLPVLRQISSGFRVILLTIAIAGIAAVIRPLPEEPEGSDSAGTEHR